MNTKNKDKLPIIGVEQFMDYYNNHNYEDDMFIDGHINPNYNSFKKTGLIAEILEDHFDDFYKVNKDIVDKYRPNAYEEFKKVIDCHNKNLGCTVYECPHCGDFIFVGNTCKSRSCSSCGYKYKLNRVESIMNTAYNCPHRQIVFTMPKEFRKYFFFPLNRIDILYEAVNLTLHSILNISYKKKKGKSKKKAYVSKTKFTPGFFAFLHTFGRDLKFNPHIHVLIAELKISYFEVKKWNYFNFDALSFRFQKILTDLMLKKIPEFTKDDARKSYLNHTKGFYVYAEKKEFKTFKDGVEYICRYCGRLAISENRIIKYENDMVTFFYNAHEDESYHEVTIHVYDFIFLLLRHVLPKNYKIIRYYGFYRKKTKLHNKIKKLIDDVKIPIRKQLLKYELIIEKHFKRNPLYCPKCDVKMKVITLIT